MGEMAEYYQEWEWEAEALRPKKEPKMKSKSQKTMLKIDRLSSRHEGGGVTYVKVADIARIDDIAADMPVREQGARAQVRMHRPKGEIHLVRETAAELVRRLEGEEA